LTLHFFWNGLSSPEVRPTIPVFSCACDPVRSMWVQTHPWGVVIPPCSGGQESPGVDGICCSSFAAGRLLGGSKRSINGDGWATARPSVWIGSCGHLDHERLIFSPIEGGVVRGPCVPKPTRGSSGHGVAGTTHRVKLPCPPRSGADFKVDVPVLESCWPSDAVTAV